MPPASATDAARGAGASSLAFVPMAPGAAARNLDARTVHVWRLARNRADGRGPLRRLLAAYLDVRPDAIEFEEGDGGKPCLAAITECSGRSPRLDFNWSHSGNWALVALARGQPVGVDIEARTRPLRVKELARRFFDPAEAAALDAVAGNAEPAFIGLWCAKEAVLKATGRGLAFGLERIAFEYRGGVDWRLRRVDPALGRLADWQLAGFEAAPRYQGALAWRGAPRRIEAFALP